jgi:hypothetical protein
MITTIASTGHRLIITTITIIITFARGIPTGRRQAVGQPRG